MKKAAALTKFAAIAGKPSATHPYGDDDDIFVLPGRPMKITKLYDGKSIFDDFEEVKNALKLC